MEKRSIGSLAVSVVGLGTNNFGKRIDESASVSVVDAAIDAGINFFDTADVYGNTQSESFLGRAVRRRRKELILATKFGNPVADRGQGAHPDYIRQAVEDSLKRLDTDYIDLYQLHRPDPLVPIAETLGALDELVRAGKVREIGCSNFSVRQLQEAHVAAGPQAARFVCVQNEYSLFHREPELGVLPYCQAAGIAFIPYFPLASGLLTGKYRLGRPLPSAGRLREGGNNYDHLLSEWSLRIVEQLIRFVESRGHNLLELAFAWLLAQPVVASVIAGATRPDQVRDNASSVQWRLDQEELASVDAILTQAVR